MRPARANQQRQMVKRRRQNVLVGLVAVLVLSGAVGFSQSIPLAKTICLMSALLLAGYVYLLVQIRKNAQARTVRYEWSSRAA
jgi:Ca2+/Na+ antiporter